MANTKSAQKELRKTEKRTIRNRKVTDNLKSLIKKSKKAIEAKDEKVKEVVEKTLKAYDKATQKGIIKKNTASRKKSKLNLKLNKTLSEKK